MILQDKVAIVTGGAQGLGGGIAQRFAAEGVKVVIADVNEQSAAQTIKIIEAANGSTIFRHTNVG